MLNTKKYIAIVSVASVLLGGVMMVSAESNNTTTNVMPARADKKMVLNIGPEGRVLLRGTISAVGTTSLTVKSWGGDWVVNVVPTTKLVPKSATIAQFAVGDFVGVNGLVSQSVLWTIDATLVRNWTEKKAAVAERKDQKIESMLEQIKKLQGQIKGRQGQ